MVYTCKPINETYSIQMNEEQLRAQLEAVFSSTSWKVTAPLRIFSKCIKAIKCMIFQRNRTTLVEEVGAIELEVHPLDLGDLHEPSEAGLIVEKPIITMSFRAQQLLKEFEWRQLKK
jgi:Pyruvate/2-oxoacid:ferredoxin oxidoreductase delta subunit